MKEKVQYETLEEVKKSPHEARTFEEILKFNPYHGYHGHFSSANAVGARASLSGKTENGQRLLDQYKENHGGKATEGSSNQKPKEYQKLTDDDAKAMAKEMGQDNIDQYEVNLMLSGNGGDTGYFGTGNSWEINESLRKGWDPTNETDPSRFDDVATIDALDKNMKPSTRDIELTRMTGNSFLKEMGLGDIDVEDLTPVDIISMAGKVYEDKGYQSTSFDETRNLFTWKPVELNIKAPKGTKLLVSPDRDSWDGKIGEAEILLARNTAMKIIKAEPVYNPRTNKIDHIEVELEVLLD